MWITIFINIFSKLEHYIFTLLFVKLNLDHARFIKFARLKHTLKGNEKCSELSKRSIRH